MPLSFSPQCCDTDHYLQIGEQCSWTLVNCWNRLRPMGAVFYFSIPYRLGFRPELLIWINCLFLGASVVLGWIALREVEGRGGRIRGIYRFLVLAFVHLWFMQAATTNALSDVPAGSLVLLCMWLLILGVLRKRVGHFIGAGCCLGSAVLLRAFYLYPALLTVAVWLLICLLARRRCLAALLFLLATVAPVLAQFTVTHERTGAWSFINPRVTDWAQRSHFESTLAGFDTVLYPAPGHGVPWEVGPVCFHKSAHPRDAVAKRDVGALACLTVKRLHYYFGSYGNWGKVYLLTFRDRHFTLGYLLLNVLFATLAVLGGLASARRQALLAPALLVGALVAQGVLLIPERRFLMVVHIALWSLALTQAPGLVASARLRLLAGRLLARWRSAVARPAQIQPQPGHVAQGRPDVGPVGG